MRAAKSDIKLCRKIYLARGKRYKDQYQSMSTIYAGESYIEQNQATTVIYVGKSTSMRAAKCNIYLRRKIYVGERYKELQTAMMIIRFLAVCTVLT